MKIAIITGASSGIGKEFVIALDKERIFDEIWVIARREDRLIALQNQCQNRIRPLSMDLSRLEEIGKLSELLNAEKPEISILVNAAGCGVFGPFDSQNLDNMLNSIRLNSEALTAVCRICIPYMKTGDKIVNIGSNSSWQPVPYQAVYGASKSFVLSLSRAIGRELKPKGIGVMCVCPGWIKTEFQAIAEHDKYIRYVDRWYTAKDVAERALKDLKKNKTVSILGLPVRMQVRLVKFLPVKLVMNIWCRQQNIK